MSQRVYLHRLSDRHPGSGRLRRVGVHKQNSTTHAPDGLQQWVLSTDNAGFLAVDDLNGDGLVVASPGTGGGNGVISLLFQHSGSLVAEAVRLDAEVHVGDLDGHGRNDVVVQSGSKQRQGAKRVVADAKPISNHAKFVVRPTKLVAAGTCLVVTGIRFVVAGTELVIKGAQLVITCTNLAFTGAKLVEAGTKPAVTGTKLLPAGTKPVVAGANVVVAGANAAVRCTNLGGVSTKLALAGTQLFLIRGDAIRGEGDEEDKPLMTGKECMSGGVPVRAPR